MATPVYVPLDASKPDGVTQPPDQYAQSDLANVRAFRDGLVCAFVPGWSFALDTTAFPIEKWLWSNGALRLRLTITKVDKGGGIYQPIKTRWEWSNDGGALYQAMSSGGLDSNITINQFGGLSAIDRDAGLLALILSAQGQSAYANGALGPHIAAVGPAVHGLGTMSTQNANAVNVTGGAIANVNANGLAIANSAMNGAYRIYPNAPPTLANNVAWDWANGPTHYRIVPNSIIPTIINAQAGEVKRIYITGAGTLTINANFIWATAHPVWGGNATLVTFCAVEPNFIVGTTIPF